MSIPTFKMPPWMCPNCGQNLDGAAAMENGWNHAPNKGDFSICAYCSTILRFQEESRLALAEEKDFENAPVEFVEALADAQKAVKMNLALAGRSDQAKPRRPN